MVVTLSLSDELYQDYVKINPQNPHKAMAKQLERFKNAAPSDRGILITGKELEEIQRAAGRQVESAQDIKELVERALSLKFEDFSVGLSAGQRARLDQDAGFWGKTPSVYAGELVKEALANRLGA